MDREILFRGKRVDNGEWVEGNHLYDEITDKHYIVPFGNINESEKVGQEGCCYCVGFEVIPETVGQYTGLTDKNGKKIFEGDILQDYLFVGKVVYNDVLAAFIVEINDSTKNWYHWSPLNKGDIDRKSKLQYTEVIGNIHDNPELLEVSE